MKIYTLPPDYRVEKFLKYDESLRFITIFLTQYDSGELRLFRCINCSRPVFQYKSDEGIIIDSSDSPKGQTSIEIKCRSCHIIYRVLW